MLWVNRLMYMWRVLFSFAKCGRRYRSDISISYSSCPIFCMVSFWGPIFIKTFLQPNQIYSNKCLIQPSTRNSILVLYGWIQLFGLIQYKEWSLSVVWSVYFVTRKAGQEQFQEKQLSHKCCTLAANVKNLASGQDWELKTRNFCFDQINFRFDCNAWSNLMHKIQFLEFYGWIYLNACHSNYLICMGYIYGISVS